MSLNVHGYATQVSDTAGLRKNDGVSRGANRDQKIPKALKMLM